MSEWIKTSERLPAKKGLYLVAFHPCYWDNVHESEWMVGADSFRGAGKVAETEPHKCWARHKYQRVVCWMPLPEPPEV